MEFLYRSLEKESHLDLEVEAELIGRMSKEECLVKKGFIVCLL